jgi:O-antigen/teichoic acid export membrane protein
VKGPIALGTIRTSFVLALRLCVQASTLLLVARMLGPEKFGLFAGLTASAVILGSLTSFGTHLVFVREVSKEPSRRNQVLPYAIPCTLLGGTLLLALYLLVCTLLLQGAKASLSTLLGIGVAEMLLLPLLNLPVLDHLALGRIARSQLLSILPLILRLIAAVAVFLWYSDDPLTAFIYGYFVASVIALIVAFATMPAPWPHPSSWRLPCKAEWRQTAGYAALTATAYGPSELDKILATTLLPPTAAGLYAAGSRVIGAVTLPVIAMIQSALPRLFREGSEQSAPTERLLKWIIAITLSYSTLLAAALWFIAPVFPKLFDERYDGIQQMIHWLCLAIPGMALRISAGGILMAIGKPWIRAGLEMAGFFSLLVASIIFTHHFGIIGVPLGLALSEWTMAVIGVIFIVASRMKPARRAG